MNTAGLDAAIVGLSVVICGGRLVFRGGEMNTGWFESGLVARMTGEIGLDGSLLGVRLGVVLIAVVTGVLRVEIEEVE